MSHRYAHCMPSRSPQLSEFVRGSARTGAALLLAIGLAAGAPSAQAQETAPAGGQAGTPAGTSTPAGTQGAAPATPPKDPSTVTPPARKDEPRSLDDLLGVPKLGTAGEQAAASAEDAARREQETRLERSLNEASMQDLVQRMVEGMKSASDRLTDSKDAGLGTQRIQEEVVKTLDRLLEEAQKQQGKKSSSSKKKQQKPGKEGEKQDPSEQNGQQQKQRSSSQSSQSSKPSSDSQDASSDAQRDDSVAEGQELSETRIEWGQLPERVRELVLQGRRDRVSTIYERLTREYYRRLAEEASR